MLHWHGGKSREWKEESELAPSLNESNGLVINEKRKDREGWSEEILFGREDVEFNLGHIKLNVQ